MLALVEHFIFIMFQTFFFPSLDQILVLNYRFQYQIPFFSCFPFRFNTKFPGFFNRWKEGVDDDVAVRPELIRTIKVNNFLSHCWKKIWIPYMFWFFFNHLPHERLWFSYRSSHFMADDIVIVYIHHSISVFFFFSRVPNLSSTLSQIWSFAYTISIHFRSYSKRCEWMKPADWIIV